MSADRVQASEISKMLAAQAEQLARELLPGGVKQGPEWRCGSVAGEAGENGGSLAFRLSGAKVGVWSDFSTGEGGDALDLVAACLTGNDMKAAYRWAHRWLGLGDLGAVQERRAQIIAKESQASSGESEEDGRRRARGMWLGAQADIGGTPVEAYLTARGIDLRMLGHATRAIRFAPEHYCRETNSKLPAMLAAICDLDGAHIATHQTWLAKDDQGVWRKAPLRNAKKIRGRFGGGSIRLRKGSSGKGLKDAPADEMVVIGEGIETCLSVALACPELRILAAASLGNMASVQLPEQVRRVLLLADKDEKPEAKRGLRRAIETHLAAGREVRTARSPKGKDFNDALN
ncbi:DUF7146 domain-containing protein [Kozakia baliensis]|uniref:Uncharacterized protein n=1 Tax=Kozakia baliensis TaxID=153496 RepID=A0A1D8UTZ2_9PROT|nr:toprim domain-containing protein [Kozakia baliensis]AOX16937.1 hypothetical protein A0U89_07065 [Kozakia baliensis]GBR25535.1 hypothetical protein AA0488_0673 [Kozakia baliensis NRIC 0488]GEL64016.1 DNA primase [Kozakia baliensis]